jgi:hypothetical protein
LTSEGTGGGSNSGVLQEVNQAAKDVFVLAVSDRVFEARGFFLTMNTNLTFIRSRDEFIATPGA